MTIHQFASEIKAFRSKRQSNLVRVKVSKTANRRSKVTEVKEKMLAMMTITTRQ